MFVTVPSMIRAVFETDLTTFCRPCCDNECYTMKFEFEISTTNDKEFKITILRVNYIPVKRPI